MAEVIAREEENFLVDVYSISTSITILLYAWITQIDREAAYIWDRPKRSSSIQYILIRYGGLASQLICMAATTYTPGCKTLNHVLNGFGQVSTLAGYVFQILRTYAVCYQNKWIIVLLSLTCLPAAAIQLGGKLFLEESFEENLLSSINGLPSIPRAQVLRWLSCQCSVNCSLNQLRSYSIALPSAIMAFLQTFSELLFESIIVLVTVWRLWPQVIEHRTFNVPFRNGRLARTIVSQGLVYLCTIVLLDIANLILRMHVHQNHVRGIQILRFLASINYPARSVLLSSFILDLRAQVENPPGTSTIHTPDLSSFEEDSIILLG